MSEADESERQTAVDSAWQDWFTGYGGSIDVLACRLAHEAGYNRALAAAREENGRLVRHLGRIEAWAQHHKVESRSQLRGTMQLVHDEAVAAREELGLSYGQMPAALAREATDADR